MPCELSGPVCQPERATPPPRDEHMAQTPQNNGPLDGRRGAHTLPVRAQQRMCAGVCAHGGARRGQAWRISRRSQKAPCSKGFRGW